MPNTQQTPRPRPRYSPLNRRFTVSKIQPVGFFDRTVLRAMVSDGYQSDPCRFDETTGDWVFENGTFRLPKYVHRMLENIRLYGSPEGV